MKKEYIILCIILTIFSQSADNNYGPNIIKNSLFSIPKIPPGNGYIITPPSIYGWNCTNKCEIDSLSLMCHSPSFYFGYCNQYDQVVDLDSDYFFEQLSQDIMIEKEGYNLITVVWLNPLMSRRGKYLGVYINSVLKAKAMSNEISRAPNTISV